MHDQRLRLEHLYDDPLMYRPKIYHYDLGPEQPINPLRHSLRIETQKLNLFPDYDLPLKQLQFTQTREYKQNLNPIFQDLSTTHDRYSYSKDWGKNKKGKNDDMPVSDRYYASDLRKSMKKIDKKHKKYEENSKEDYLIREDKVRCKRLVEKVVPEHDTVPRMSQVRKETQIQGERLTSSQLAEEYLQKIVVKTQKLQKSLKESEDRMNLLQKQVQMHKQKQLIKEKQLFYLEKQKQSVISKSKSLSESLKSHSAKYLQTESLHTEMSKTLRMKKQQLKKERHWLEEESAEIHSIQGKIQELLKLIRKAQDEEEKQEDMIRKYQEEHELNQQLQDQLADTQSTIESLTQQTNLVEEETTTLEMHLNQLLALEEKFQQETYTLLSTIDHLNQEIAQKQEYLSQEPEIDQLIKQVELEMGQINQKNIILEQEIHDVNVKISLKKRNVNYIQHHIDQNQNKRKHSPPKIDSLDFKKKPHTYNDSYYEQNQNPQNSQGEEPKYNNEFSFTSLGNYNLNMNSKNSHQSKLPPNQNTNLNSIKQPLPTIRQNSNNTSAYQSPKLSPNLLKSNQNSPAIYLESQQPPLHHNPQQPPIPHLESQSLEIDSRMLSQTQVFKTHNEESVNRKPKKYFVIESQDDAGLSHSKSAFQYAKSYLEQQSHLSKPFETHQNRSQQMFIEKQKKPSIEHRIYQNYPSVLHTEQQLEEKKHKQSFSAELQSSNYFQSANNRLDSQQSEFPVMKFPPKSNDQKHAKRQKPSDKKSKSKHYSNNYRNQNIDSPSQFIQESQDAIENLIGQYEHIKTNSCFQESWTHKI